MTELRAAQRGEIEVQDKERVYSSATSMPLLWPTRWGMVVVATLLSTPVQLPDALLDF